MNTQFLNSFSKGSKNYTGDYPIYLDGSINCVNESSLVSNIYPSEKFTCESIGYSSTPFGACPNGSNSVTYTDAVGNQHICYTNCIVPFEFDGPVYDVDYDNVRNRVWVVGEFSEKIKKLDVDLQDDTSFDPQLAPTTNFDQVYSLRLTGGCFVGSFSKIIPHVGATNARGFRYKSDGEFIDTFAITDTHHDGNRFNFIVLENLDVIHIGTYVNFNSYNLSSGSRIFTQSMPVNCHGVLTNFDRDKVVLTTRPTVSGPKTNPLNPRSLKYLDGTSLLLEPSFTSNGGTGLGASTFAGLNESNAKIGTNPLNSYIYVSTNDNASWGGTDYSWNGGSATKHTFIAKIGIDGIEASDWNTSGNDSLGYYYNWSVFTVDSNDRVYVGGSIAAIRGVSVDAGRLYRLLENGDYDTSFSHTFNGMVRGALWCEIDNSLLVWGDFTEVDGDDTKKYLTKIAL